VRSRGRAERRSRCPATCLWAAARYGRSAGFLVSSSTVAPLAGFILAMVRPECGRLEVDRPASGARRSAKTFQRKRFRGAGSTDGTVCLWWKRGCNSAGRHRDSAPTQGARPLRTKTGGSV
jgi:hypothetical protein